MRLFLLAGLVIFLLSCNKKTKLTTQAAYNKCMVEMIDSPSLDSLIKRKNIYIFCNCLSEKAVQVFKTEEEFNKSSPILSNLAELCIDEIMGKIGK